jgi:hypothetical protein
LFSLIAIILREEFPKVSSRESKPGGALTTVDGTSIWAGDGVQLTSKHIVTEGAGGEPANKRARLESVIPTQATPKFPKPNIPSPLPPEPKPVPLPLWLSGQLPAAQRGRGAGGHQRGPQKGGRGGQGPRGGHSPGAAPGAATKAAGDAGSPQQ